MAKFVLRNRLGIGYVKEARLQGAVYGGGYKVFYTDDLSKAMTFDNQKMSMDTIEAIRRKSPLIAENLEVGLV